MARLIRHDATGPAEIPPQARSVWACRCGLSQNQPYCDGSHAQVRAEAPGTLHAYDPIGQYSVASIADTQDLAGLLLAPPVHPGGRHA